jgi:hypothetical protein
MDIVNTYVELGSYRAAGDLCAVDHKTVKRVVQRWRTGSVAEPRITPARGRNTDCVEDLIWERVKKSRGRITAKRLLPQALLDLRTPGVPVLRHGNRLWTSLAGPARHRPAVEVA